VVSGCLYEVSQGDLVFFAAGTAASGDFSTAEKAGDFNSAVIPAVDENVAEIRQRRIRHRAGVSAALAYFQRPQGAWNHAY
jgi:hypothetical protein